VTAEPWLSFWSRPNHNGPQANCEAVFVSGGSLYAVVKSGPARAGLAAGQSLRLPSRPGPGGAAADAVHVADLRPAPGTAWGSNYRPNGADLRDGRLLLSTGSRWLRYDGDPSLSGDALVRGLASRPPAFRGDWRQGAAPAGNEAIAWFPPPRRPGQPAAVASSFLALAESGLFRWLPPAAPGRLGRPPGYDLAPASVARWGGRLAWTRPSWWFADAGW
jgi:hypothetical protein